MSEAYMVGHLTVRHPQKWEEYTSLVPATLVPYGGEVVFRGEVSKVLAGEHPHTRVVVLRFPDSASVQAWHDSPAYQALVPLRFEAADGVLIACSTARSPQ